MRLLVKIGGAQLAKATATQELAQAVAAARAAGHEVLVVHGGGDQIRAASKKLGLVLRLLPPYVVTDEQIAQALALIRQGLAHIVSTKVAS